MSDFASMDWDLQAIVRGCSTDQASIDSVMDSPQSCINFSPLLNSPQQDVMFKFPDVSWDELEELYKPFYPQTILTTTTTTTSISVPKKVNKNTKKQRRQQPPPPKLSDSASTTNHPAAEQKKGKNQHKRVVQKVITADGLACDKWAWRKYGQKPIKGSPHPRSYYKCSSSKGCLARKQVERSSTDPGVFIVTYSAEHNHSLPTRRSSLAGSTRNKASVMALARGDAKINEPLELKEEDREDEFVMPDMILSDELFPSLEDLEGLLLDDQSPENNISDNSWFIDESVNL